jgi:hypothetical protein
MLADLVRLFSGGAAAFVAMLMLRAAVHKVAEGVRFEGVLADYGLVPDWGLKPLRMTLPLLEIASAVGLCLAPLRPAGAALAASLLLTYGAAVMIAFLQGRSEIDCGCGGPALPLGWGLVGRNLILAAALAPASLGLALWRTPTEAVAGWAVAASAMLCWAVGEQLAANHHRMRRTFTPGAEQMFGRPA